MADNNNLLVRLHRWVHRQDENFTTEAFVHVLQHLLDHEGQIAARFLAWLTNGKLDFQPHEISGVSLNTQVAISTGRPDVEIQTLRHRVFLEAKVESGVGMQQLEKYRRELDNCGSERSALILLTRYPVPPEVLGGRPDKCLRWYQIADWLADEVAAGTTQDAVSSHMMGQFLGFLSGRGMTMEQVGWEMAPGVRDMCNFLAMLAEAASACKLSVRQGSKLPEYVGCYTDKQRYWIGFGCEEPGLLYAQTNMVRIDVDRATKLGKGELWPESWAPSRQVWALTLNLRAEEVHFFARSRASQVQCLEKFIGDFLETAKMIEVPD